MRKLLLVAALTLTALGVGACQREAEVEPAEEGVFEEQEGVMENDQGVFEEGTEIEEE